VLALFIYAHHILVQSCKVGRTLQLSVNLIEICYDSLHAEILSGRSALAGQPMERQSLTRPYDGRISRQTNSSKVTIYLWGAYRRSAETPPFDAGSRPVALHSPSLCLVISYCSASPTQCMETHCPAARVADAGRLPETIAPSAPYLLSQALP
jgi:hypothetical protein